MTTEKQFYLVANVAEIPAQTGKTVLAGDTNIALFNLSGTFYAISDRCPHRGASLGDGFINGPFVLCPSHLFDFNLASGHCTTVPELQVSTYEVKVEGDEIFVLA